MMHVIHINTPPAKKPKTVRKQSSRLERARRWMAVQSQQDYEKALLENQTAINKIRKHTPGWMPDKS